MMNSVAECLDNLFTHITTYPPQSVALICGDHQLTYQELDQRSNQVAQYLDHLRIPENALIGIYMERSIEIVVTILGVLKSGRTYVPLDPHYPEERIEFIAQETQVAILLTQEDLCDRLSHLQDTKKVCIDSQWNIIAQSSYEPIKREIDSESLAYVMYTSGSTGKPKGVKMPRINIFRYITAIADIIPVQAEDNYLHTASFSFSASLRQLLLPLSVGATVVIASREQAKSPQSIIQLIHQNNITVFDSVSSVWRYFLQLANESDKFHQKVAQLPLKYSLLCGELTPCILLANIHRIVSDRVQFFNIYGQTETIGSTAYRIPNPFPKTSGYVPIGYPYPHNQTFILDENLNPVPDGEIGSLYMAGGCLAQGYMNRDDLTAEKFIKNPWQNGSDRIFNTGDLARQDPDGRLELLGRTDFQVKIRGMRVELDEISAVLEQHPEVKTAATAAHESTTGDLMVVGYVVPYAEQTTGTQWHHTLRQFLGEHLPDYMVPALFMELEALPKTPSGKLDRNALPTISSVKSSIQNQPKTLPQTDLEEKILGIWMPLLDSSEIGVTDNFFDLGGHSLLAAQMLSQIEQLSGITLPMSTMFQAPTITELAKVLQSQSSSHEWPTLVPMQVRSGAKLFCISGILGNVLTFTDLVRELGTDISVYGLQPPGLDGKTLPLTTIEDIAAHYVEEIIKLDSDEPCFLLGYSFGGMVAYEVAQHLQQLGKDVPFVCIIDTSVNLPKHYRYWEDIRKVFTHGWSYLQYRTLNIVHRYISPKIQQWTQRQPQDSQYQPPRALNQLVDQVRQAATYGDRSFALWMANEQASIHYTPKSYDGNIVLFRTEADDSQAEQFRRLDLGWNYLAKGNLTIQEIEGTHSTILQKPHVRKLAKGLEPYLKSLERTI